MPENPRVEAIRNRISVADAQTQFGDFCASFQTMLLSTVSADGTPAIDNVIYRFGQGEHVILLSPQLSAFNNIENGAVAGMLLKPAPADGPDLPFMRHSLNCRFKPIKLPVTEEVLRTLPVKIRKTVRHIVKAHGGQLYQLKIMDGRFSLGFHQVFTINEKNEVVGLASHDGEPRHEFSRLIVLAYADKERLMSALVEGDTYLVLAKKNSRKVKHFTHDPACHIYDGRGVEFDARATIVEDPEQIKALFDRLTETKNNYFKNNSGLVLLKFNK